MAGDDIFVAGPRQDIAKLKKRWETCDQMIGPKRDDQKELRILNRTLRWCKDGLVVAANLRHGREVVGELGLSKSKPVLSPATADGAARCEDDESKSLDEEGKRLHQRIIAKLNYLAHDRLDLKYATSCLASAVSSPGTGYMRAAKRVGGRRRWLGGLGVLSGVSEIDEWGCRDSWWWSPQLLVEEAEKCRTIKLGE